MPATTSKECFHTSVHGLLNMQLAVSSLVFRGQESAAEIGFAGAGPGVKIEIGVQDPGPEIGQPDPPVRGNVTLCWGSWLRRLLPRQEGRRRCCWWPPACVPTNSNFAIYILSGLRAGLGWYPLYLLRHRIGTCGREQGVPGRTGQCFFFQNAFRFPEYFQVEASKARNKRVRRARTPFRGGAGPSGAGGPTVPEATGLRLVAVVHTRCYAHLGPQKCARRTTLSILLPLFVTCASTSGKTQLQRTARMRHLALQACAAIRKGCNSVHRFPHKKWCFLMPILPYFPGGSRPRTPGRGGTPRSPPEWKVP